jgi:hypothetical protein
VVLKVAGRPKPRPVLLRFDVRQPCDRSSILPRGSERQGSLASFPPTRLLVRKKNVGSRGWRLLPRVTSLAAAISTKLLRETRSTSWSRGPGLFIGEAPAKRRSNRGFCAGAFHVWRGPHAAMLYNVAACSVSCTSLCNAKHASHKKSPEGGLTARGYTGSMVWELP